MISLSIFFKSSCLIISSHSLLPSETNKAWTNEERVSFQNEVESFFTLTSKNLQDLHRQLEALILFYMKENSSSEEAKVSDHINDFYNEVMKSLVQSLRDLTKLWEKTQKQREKMKSQPHRLFSSYYPAITDDNLLLDSSISSPSSSSSRSFSQRYTDEIASGKKMNAYEEISKQQFELTKQKEQELVNKFKVKRVKFDDLVEDAEAKHSSIPSTSSYTKNFFNSLIDGKPKSSDSNPQEDEDEDEDELNKVKKIESSVSTLSNLIIDFNTILSSQNDLIENIEQETGGVLDSVQDTDQILLKTLEREQKNSWVLIGLINCLTILILLLHFFNP